MKHLLPLLFLFSQAPVLPAQSYLSFFTGINRMDIVSKEGDSNPHLNTAFDSGPGFGALFTFQPEMKQLLKPNFDLGYTRNTGTLDVFSGGLGSWTSRQADLKFHYLLIGFRPEVYIIRGQYELGIGLGGRLQLLLNNERVEVIGSAYNLADGSSSIEENGRARDYLRSSILSWYGALRFRRWFKETLAIGLLATYGQGEGPGKDGFDTGNFLRNSFLGVGFTYKTSWQISFD